MRFTVTQTINAPLDEVAAAYASTGLYESLDGDSRLGPPEVLDRSEDGDTVTLRIRYRYIAEMSAAVAAVVRPDRLSWVEESVHDLTEGSVKVTLHPDNYADRLQGSAHYRYEAKGTSTERHIEGEVRVRAPLVAGKVEQAIVDGLKEHLALEADRVEAYLRG